MPYIRSVTKESTEPFYHPLKGKVIHPKVTWRLTVVRLRWRSTRTLSRHTTRIELERPSGSLEDGPHCTPSMDRPTPFFVLNPPLNDDCTCKVGLRWSKSFHVPWKVKTGKTPKVLSLPERRPKRDVDRVQYRRRSNSPINGGKWTKGRGF